MNTTLDNIQHLVEDLNYHTKLYNEGKPIISDAKWDEMYFNLQNLERTSGIYLENSPTQKIEYQVISALQKVKHNHPMLSLDKTKDWNEFLNYFASIDVSKSVVGMLKLDGLTCSLRYVDGKLVSAETRGNGIEGEDILHNALVIHNIPKKINFKEELIIDGEIICTYQNFDKFKDEYANPRNFAAGSIRLLDSAECERRGLSFIAWNIVKAPWDSLMDGFFELYKLGFSVTPWTSSFDWDAREFLIDQAKEYGYPIDGLVGRFNSRSFGDSLGATGHHSRAAYAFKFYDEEYETKLLDIEWTMGRTGALTPVAIFEPVDTGDSIIERANVHNISVLHETLGSYPHKGQVIKVFKANDIIPQINDAENKEYQDCKYYEDKSIFSVPTECPICGGALEIECEVDSEILICKNPECEGQLINRLDHFCGKKGLDIKGLSKSTLGKLISWGWVSEPADLYNLKEYEDEWMRRPGFGIKSVQNILNAIEESRKPRLEAFISALGIPMIGNTMSKEIVKHFKTYEEFRDAAKSHWDFTQIDKIAYEKASSIWNFNFSEADRVNEYIILYQEDVEETLGQNLINEKIAITGSLSLFKNRTVLQAAIESRGGKVVSGVSKNTTMLINNNPNSGSSKNITATKLGVPIITEQEFVKRYLEN